MRKNPVLRFFAAVVTVALTLALLLTAALAYSAFDRRSPLSSVPRNYSVYMRTESAFAMVNPLFDLRAADVFLSAPELSSVRRAFMNFRSSALRESHLVRLVLSRPVDLALYDTHSRNPHFVAVVNFGMLSLFTRIISVMYPKVGYEVKNLSYETGELTSFFVYELPGQEEGAFTRGPAKIYIKAVKNLVIASDSFEHLLTASLAMNDMAYTEEQRNLFKGVRDGELRIVADAGSLLGLVTEENGLLSKMAGIVSADSLSLISFNINDSDVSLRCRIPVHAEGELSALLSKKSTAPAILSRLSDITQYYTILNAGSLEKVKDAALPFIPDVRNPVEFWENADEWSRTLLGMDLNEFLFSWTGDEAAVLGVENQNDPVFVVQVKDERQRQKVFDKLTSSILITDDNSLILDGARLSRLKFPAFFRWLLSVLGVSLPSPYFMVLDGNIYFSESAECLSAVFTSARSGKTLVRSKDYLAVSDGQRNESSLSLFYNLERSVPFFLHSDGNLAKVLQLYTMGRFDARFEEEMLELSLHACARKSGDLYSVPGFPLALEGRASPENLQVDSGKNPGHVYWLEDERRIKALDIMGMTVVSKEEPDKTAIVASGKIKNGGALWSVSPLGAVSLMNSSLENLSGFPLMLGERISCRPCAVGENLVLLSDSGSVLIVKPDMSLVTIKIPGLSAKSEAVSLGEAFVVYSKGFLGKIYYFEGDRCLNLDNPFEVPGIAIGSPALMRSGGKNYIGLVTQAGEMNVWRADSRSGGQAAGFPKRIGGVFMTNARSSDRYFYALSTDAVLYRISLDGSLLSVQIPDSTAREAYLSVAEPEHNGKRSVFVCADANVIYGFNENLELLSGYPLTGFGRPVFADVNGDKIGECIALSLDKRLVAWKTR